MAPLHLEQWSAKPSLLMPPGQRFGSEWGGAAAEIGQTEEDNCVLCGVKSLGDKWNRNKAAAGGGSRRGN